MISLKCGVESKINQIHRGRKKNDGYTRMVGKKEKWGSLPNG